MTTLVSRRLVLREFRPSDEEAVHAFAADPEVTRYTDWGPNGPIETRAYLSNALDRQHAVNRLDYYLAAALRGTGEVIGSIELRITNRRHRRGELGFVLHRGHWGQGYASEAARTLLAFGFAELGLGRVQATCHPGNTRSAAALKRAGMEYEGRMRNHLLVDGIWRDSLLFAAIPAAEHQ